MRAVLVALSMLLLQGSFDRVNEVDATPQRFRFQRELKLPASAEGQACAALDAAVYEHAEGSMGALRVYQLSRPGAPAEVPFALTESGEAGQETETARAINAGRKGSAIVFDLVMPSRTYTAVELGLSGHDFYATATVSGSDGKGGAKTELGTFALFDLTGRGLSRSTTLPLQEVSFAQLHVELTVTPAPGGKAAALGPEMVGDAQVPPSREAQTLYTGVAATATRSSADPGQSHVDRFELAVAAHVPVERVTFRLRPGFDKNFLRNVSLGERPSGSKDTESAFEPLGQIVRVHLPGVGGGMAIREEELSLAAVSAANLRSGATFVVAVDNGDDAPLPITQVQLEMREREVCFEAEPGVQYALRYGAAEPVRAPVYDYARLFRAEPEPIVAKMDAELPNPAYRVDIRQTTYMERHPEVLWVALLAVIAVLGTVALHSARRAGMRG